MHILIGIVASVIKGRSLQWVNLIKSWGRSDTQNVTPTVIIVNTSIILGKKRNHNFYQHSVVHKMAPKVHKNWFPTGNLTRMDKVVDVSWSPFRELGQLESPWISAHPKKSNHSASCLCSECFLFVSGPTSWALAGSLHPKLFSKQHGKQSALLLAPPTPLRQPWLTQLSWHTCCRSLNPMGMVRKAALWEWKSRSLNHSCSAAGSQRRARNPSTP